MKILGNNFFSLNEIDLKMKQISLSFFQFQKHNHESLTFNRNFFFNLLNLV